MKRCASSKQSNVHHGAPGFTVLIFYGPLHGCQIKLKLKRILSHVEAWWSLLKITCLPETFLPWQILEQPQNHIHRTWQFTLFRPSALFLPLFRCNEQSAQSRSALSSERVTFLSGKCDQKLQTPHASNCRRLSQQVSRGRQFVAMNSRTGTRFCTSTIDNDWESLKQELINSRHRY